MGNTYTKEELIEFEQYKKMMRQAFDEKDRWMQYKLTRKTLDKNLREKTRYVKKKRRKIYCRLRQRDN